MRQGIVGAQVPARTGCAPSANRYQGDNDECPRLTHIIATESWLQSGQVLLTSLHMARFLEAAGRC